MIEYRPIKPEEIEEVLSVIKSRYPWAATPQWESVNVYVNKDGRIVGFNEFQIRQPTLASCVSWNPDDTSKDNPVVTQALIERADQQLTMLGYKSWEFIVPDENIKMQEFLEKRYGLKGQKEIPHKIYFIER